MPDRFTLQVDYFPQPAFSRVIDANSNPPDQTTLAATRGGAAVSGRPLSPLLEGQQVGGCTLVKEVGRGGMGVVWHARQQSPARDVALKMLQAGPGSDADEFHARFHLEARTLAVLEHPAILPLYEFGDDGGLAWFTMKLASGGSLASRKTALAGKYGNIARLMVTLAGALQFAHDRGVLHRDLKPGNVLFDSDDRPYIADFGLAKLAGESSVLDGSLAVLGTPAYLAPEVASADARAATTSSDVYSLGATLYELLAGVPPFSGPSLHSLLKDITSTTPVAPSRRPAAPPTALTAPRDLEIICLKCLEKDPARRYPSARHLAADLERWLEGRPIEARKASPAERLHAWARRNPAIAGLTAALGLAIAIAGVLLTIKNAALGTANAALGTALREATVARDSAEQNIEFLTREFGGKLEKSGQLGMLNDVYQQVSRYYAAHPADLADPAAAARQISFLTHWGQALLPQGDGRMALDHCQQAVSLAQKAAARHPADVQFVILQAGALRWTGDALSRLNRDQEAAAAFERGFTLLRSGTSNAEKAALCELLSAAAWTSTHLRKYDEAVPLLAEATSIAQGLLASDPSPENQAVFALVMKADGVVQRSRVREMEKAGNRDDAAAQLAKAQLCFEKMRDALIPATAAAPDRLPWKRELAEAHNWLASVFRRQSPPDFTQARLHLAEQRRIMEPLIAAEPANGEWQSELVLNAQAEAGIAKQLAETGDTGDHMISYREWTLTQVTRAERLTAAKPTIRQWWVNLASGRWALADLAAEEGDEAASLEHARPGMEANLELLRLGGSTDDEFKNFLTRVNTTVGLVRRLEKPAAAAAWLESWGRKLSADTGALPETIRSPWLSRAALMLRSAALNHDLLGETGKAAAAAEQAFTCWAQAVKQPGGPEKIPGLVRNEARDQVTLLLTGARPDAALSFARRALEFPATFPASVPAEWRSGWIRLAGDLIERAEKHSPETLAKMQSLARATLPAFITPAPDEGETKALQRLQALLDKAPPP